MVKKKYIAPRALAVFIGLEENVNQSADMRGSQYDTDDSESVKGEHAWGDDETSSTSTGTSTGSKSIWDEQW